MTLLEERIAGAGSIMITGHVNPDGDCVGSALALLNYICEYFPDKRVRLFLEKKPEKFAYLKGFDQILCEVSPGEEADLLFCVDSSDRQILGPFGSLLDHAARSVCIDHHVTNTGYCMENIVFPLASSACEVMFMQMDEEKIGREIAECLYTGIITDSGLFRYNNTSSLTMQIAGKLMDKGVDFERIADRAYFRRTYMQTQILGRALLESVRFMDGKCIFSVVRKKDMAFYRVDRGALEGIVEQLRLVDGVETAIVLTELDTHIYKVSLRSKRYIDVSSIARYFGGGGHKKAAGCTMTGSARDVINNLAARIEMQMAQAAGSTSDGLDK